MSIKGKFILVNSGSFHVTRVGEEPRTWLDMESIGTISSDLEGSTDNPHGDVVNIHSSNYGDFYTTKYTKDELINILSSLRKENNFNSRYYYSSSNGSENTE